MQKFCKKLHAAPEAPAVVANAAAAIYLGERWNPWLAEKYW